jgi:DNA polymerase-3 subunit epsilon
MIFDKLAFVDVETTGCSPTGDSVIDIGIVRVENNKVVEIFQSLVNPNRSLPPEITLLTGINERELENAPTFRKLKNRVKQLLDGAVFVAHNARFDYSFIKNEFQKQDEVFKSKLLCTVKLSRRLYPDIRGHNLDSIIERFKIKCDSRHRALPDARVLWEFMKILRKIHGDELLDLAISDVTKTAALPPGIEASVIEDLPETPGVYTFYNHEGAKLYIGKSLNIHDRVLSHFYDFSTRTSEANIFQNISSVETVETSGELGALLLESAMIKRDKPLLNHKLRNSDGLIAVLKYFNDEGYLTLKSASLGQITVSELSDVVGIFRSKSQLKTGLVELSGEYSLCQKLLGLEKSKGACFGHQLGSCRGACIKNEPPVRYNMRFTEAFSKSRITDWPFPGPVTISEGNTSYMVDRWCYIGRSDEISPDAVSDPESLHFDYDIYQIFRRFIFKKARDVQIRVFRPK